MTPEEVREAERELMAKKEADQIALEKKKNKKDLMWLIKGFFWLIWMLIKWSILIVFFIIYFVLLCSLWRRCCCKKKGKVEHCSEEEGNVTVKDNQNYLGGVRTLKNTSKLEKNEIIDPSEKAKKGKKRNKKPKGLKEDMTPIDENAHSMKQDLNVYKVGEDKIQKTKDGYDTKEGDNSLGESNLTQVNAKNNNKNKKNAKKKGKLDVEEELGINDNNNDINESLSV